MASSRLERIGTIFTRNQNNDELLKALVDITNQMQTDIDIIKENEQKVHRFLGVIVNSLKQNAIAYEEKLAEFKKIIGQFKNKVEGLITRGGMKPDERPLWFDVYKAFPPITEPKLAKPKPEIKPIRQILYKEDVLRAEFHSKGYGLGAVNMLTSTGETHTKKLINQYNKLKEEGVPEDELISKTVESTNAERDKERAEKTEKVDVNPYLGLLNPRSKTATVLHDVNIKNIFHENSPNKADNLEGESVSKTNAVRENEGEVLQNVNIKNIFDEEPHKKE